MVINEEYKIATEILYDEAHLWMEDCIHEIQTEMTFTEKRTYITARNRGFKIMPGELYRTYIWVEGGLVWSGGSAPEPMYEEVNSSTVIEIPALHEICKRLKLYHE